MRGLILAAGLGTRLRPLTETVPKCLVPIHNRPLLGYWFDLLLGTGVCERLLVNTSWLAPQVERFVADSAWRDRVDLVNETELLGTGGTIRSNREWLEGGPFFVVHGDNLSSFDPHAFVHRHRGRPPQTEITMMTFTTDAPQSCGIVELNEEGVVTAFHEKVPTPPGNQANGAVYIFEPSVLEYINSLNGPFIDLSTEVLPAYIGRMCTFTNTGYHRDIGTLESLAKAQVEFPVS